MSTESNATNKDWRNELMEKYDDMFGDRRLPMAQTCMCWGLEVDDGWKGLLEEMCAKLKILQDYTGARVKFMQVKSKYATLRAYHYVNVENVKESDKELVQDIVSDIVDAAERKSGHVCELCGEPGEERGGGWITTLCWKCAFKDEKVLNDYEQTKLTPKEKKQYDAYIAVQEKRHQEYLAERKAREEKQNDA